MRPAAFGLAAAVLLATAAAARAEPPWSQAIEEGRAALAALYRKESARSVGEAQDRAAAAAMYMGWVQGVVFSSPLFDECDLGKWHPSMAVALAINEGHPAAPPSDDLTHLAVREALGARLLLAERLACAK